MYIPESFKIEDLTRLQAFIRQYSFGTLTTQQAGVPYASHVPLLLDAARGPRGTLVGHLARANPQWQHLATGAEMLVIFHGPHAYVSPTWYRTRPAVPTWNYAVVHAYGTPRVSDDRERLLAWLDDMVRRYEDPLPKPWDGQVPEDFRDRLLSAIIGFEVEITRLEGKFKLSQNRSAEDVESVIQSLHRSPSASGHALAEMMRVENRARGIQE